MIVAIDFDDTFTADPVAWTKAIEVLQNFGHQVLCVSARRNTIEHREVLAEALPSGVRIYLSYDMPKREFMRKYKIEVNVWIDDMPEAIPTKDEFMRIGG